MRPEDKKDIIDMPKRTEIGTALLKSGDKVIVVRNHSFSYTIKKIEKLASGLHLVTNLIPTTESVRDRMRNLSLRVLSDFLILGNGSIDQGNIYRTIESPIVYTTIENDIIELVTLLNVSHVAEYISSMNKDILIREYTELLGFIREHQEVLTSKDMTISDEFLNVSIPKIPQITVREPRERVTGESSGTAIKDISKPASPKGQSTARTVGSGSVTKRRDDRRSVILNLLKSQNKIGVKDVSPLISECSEKTLQRELLAMVDEGILIKEGERRWSTYSLAT